MIHSPEPDQQVGIPTAVRLGRFLICTVRSVVERFVLLNIGNRK